MVYVCKTYKFIKKTHRCSVFHATPVCLIETCMFSYLQIRLISYCTLNRIITYFFQTVRLIKLYAKQKPQSIFFHWFVPILINFQLVCAFRTSKKHKRSFIKFKLVCAQFVPFGCFLLNLNLYELFGSFFMKSILVCAQFVPFGRFFY